MRPETARPRRLAFALAALALTPACGTDSISAGVPVDDMAVRPTDAAPTADAFDAPGGKADGSGGTVTPDATRDPEPDADAGPVPDPSEPDGAAPDTTPGPDAGQDEPGEPDAGAPEPEPVCPEPAIGAPADWRHGLISPATVALGLPQHSAVEPIVNPGADIAVAGKFAYGVISKDLEDEDVELWLRLPDLGGEDCGAWRSVGRATTDSDGRATVSVDPALVPEPGAYDFRFVVRGDRTAARGAVWVVEPGTALVLFDVDGTLTIGDSEIFEQVLLGQDPEMYAAADTVVSTYAGAGYQPLYVTGRPYFLNPATRTWLEAHGFPPGPVRTADDVGSVLPTEGGVQTDKREYLRDLIAETGVSIPYAYGNATTDICAYAEAGIDPARTHIIGPHAGEACAGYGPTVALEDYPTHLPALANLPPAP
jgi:hypothetical protein